MENKKPKISKRFLIIIISIILIIIIDQVIKSYFVNNGEKSIDIINGILKFTYVENTGGAFGSFQNNINSFIILNFIVLGIIIKFMISQKDRIDNKTSLALTLILAGGISNLIDRILRGFVVDYIDITQLVSFPVFNLADICIVLGWILLVIFILIYSVKEPKKQNIGVKNEIYDYDK